MAITVTATQGGSTAPGFALRVFVLTQAAATQNGATGSANATTNAGQASITTTQTGSRVYGAKAGTNVASTPNGSTTQVDDIADAVNTERYGTFKATALTGTPGAVTIGDTNTGDVACALLEVRTAGTLTEDASGPAVASTTGAGPLSTASFTPPAGSLLVALIGSDGGAAVTTFTVSGGGLTWVAKIEANASGLDYAGVWVAQVPPASGGSPQGTLFLQRRLPQSRQVQPPPPAASPVVPMPGQPQATALLYQRLPQSLPSPQVPPPPAPGPAPAQGTALLLEALPVTPQYAQQASAPPLVAQPQHALTFIQRGMATPGHWLQATAAVVVVPPVAGQPQAAVTLLQQRLPVSAPGPAVPAPPQPLPAPEQSVTLTWQGRPQSAQSPQAPQPAPPGAQPPQSVTLVAQGVATPGNFFQQPPVIVPPPPAGSNQQGTGLLARGLPQSLPSPQVPPPAPPGQQPQNSAVLLIQGLLQQQAQYFQAALPPPPVVPMPGQPQGTALLARGMATPGHWLQAPAVAVIPPPPAQAQPQAVTLLRLGLPVPAPGSTLTAAQFPGAVTVTSKTASPVTLSQAAASVTITSHPASPVTLKQAAGSVTITSRVASPVTVRSQL